MVDEGRRDFLKRVLEGSVMAAGLALLPGSGLLDLFSSDGRSTSVKVDGNEVDKVPVGRPR